MDLGKSQERTRFTSNVRILFAGDTVNDVVGPTALVEAALRFEAEGPPPELEPVEEAPEEEPPAEPPVEEAPAPEGL